MRRLGLGVVWMMDLAMSMGMTAIHPATPAIPPVVMVVVVVVVGTVWGEEGRFRATTKEPGGSNSSVGEEDGAIMQIA